MRNFLIDIAPPLLETFAVGVTGWLVKSFVARPILEFYKLRASVHEELIFTANVLPLAMNEAKYDQANENLRRLATKLSAFIVSAVAVT